MGSISFFLIAIASVTFVASPALATDFMVGDEKGWTTNFDYQAWAMGKEFRVGDTLIFKYPQGVHNVHRVNGTAFQQCAPPSTSVALTSGNDVIPLATPGQKWYICGIAKHCEIAGQKLAITVMPTLESPAPSPSDPTSATTGITSSKYFPLMISAFSTLLMIMV